MKLIAYKLQPDPPPLRAAVPDRAWMDAFPSRHAYRCLPLAIANSFGWEILSPFEFELIWNGGPLAEDITVTQLCNRPHFNHFAASHFTHAVVTFHLGYLFRTEPGWDMLATGPFNRPRDGFAPLSGVIETSWLPYSFTMNWMFTRPCRVHFKVGDPVCLIFPVPHGALEEIDPVIRPLESDPELQTAMQEWANCREKFMEKFRAGDPATLKEGWQRYYFRGERPDQGAVPEDHINKLRLKEPKPG